MIVANDVSAATGVFGGDHNKVHIVTSQGVESWPEMAKREVAGRLMQRLAVTLIAKTKVAE
jgi:phosphopantothenoylcysteine decarboxylase/phosphopantothenate--cysteine ligase